MTPLYRILWSLAILALLAGIFILGWNARRIPACVCWCDEPVTQVVQPKAGLTWPNSAWEKVNP